jgi:hypothetical protein
MQCGIYWESELDSPKKRSNASSMEDSGLQRWWGGGRGAGLLDDVTFFVYTESAVGILYSKGRWGRLLKVIFFIVN